jgi:putative peptidoglycan lipid II flippase
MKVKQTALSILLLSLFLKLVGFLRESVIAKQFGANAITDGFLLAYTVLTLFMLIVSTGFNNVFLPIYAKFQRAKDKFARSNENALLNVSVLLFLAFGLVVYGVLLALEPLAAHKQTLQTALTVGRFFSVFTFLLALQAMLESYLQVKHSYVPTQTAKLLAALFSAGFGLFLAQDFGIMSIAYGFMVGTALGVMLQIFYLFRRGYEWRLTFLWEPEFGKTFAMLLWPALLNAIVGPLNVFIDKIFATATIAGAVTYLNNASLIVSIPGAVYTTTIGALIFTFLTEKASSPADFSALLRLGMEMGFLLFLPMAVGLAVIGEDIVALIYQHGAFTKADTAATYQALALYAPLVAVQGVQIVISKALFALEQNKALLKLSATTIFLNIVLNALFMKWLGFQGLALSSSLVAVYYFLLSVRLLTKSGMTKANLQTLAVFWQSFIPALIMGLALLGIRHFHGLFEQMLIIKVIMEIFLGAVIYGGTSWFFNRNGVMKIFILIKKKKTSPEEPFRS